MKSTSSVFNSPEYKAISMFYGERTAKRSGVPLMNHIHEGVKVMQVFDASNAAMRAYMLHPLFQHDDQLTTVGIDFANRNIEADPFIVMLAMEYRARANGWLSYKVENKNDPTFNGWPSPGSIREVKLMLIADKVQNRKDFELYHKGTHERSDELEVYFRIWLDVLGIDEVKYQELVQMLKA